MFRAAYFNKTVNWKWYLFLQKHKMFYLCYSVVYCVGGAVLYQVGNIFFCVFVLAFNQIA